MPFTNGIFTRVRSWVADKAAGLTIDPALMDQDANDIALGLSSALLRDGTGSPTADISFAGHAATNLKAPANAGDALSLGSTPSTEISRALGFQPVSSGPAGGHQVAITYDGTGLTSSVDGNAAFGRVWTANTLGAAQVEVILGFVPCTNYSGSAHAVGLAYDGNGIVGVVDGNSNFGYLYGAYNFTSGIVTGALGYTPNRICTPFAGALSAAGDLPPADTVVVSCSFTATGTSALITGGCSIQNNTSGAVANAIAQYIELYDNTAGSGAGSTAQQLASVSYGQGYCNLNSHFCTGGLTVGHTYTARLHLWKGSTSSVTSTTTVVIVGENF